jgi:sodium-dependent phosphate cotransporter
VKGKTRGLLAAFSITMFVFGLQLLGDSTEAVAELLRGLVKAVVTGDLSALGAGWFLAYIVLNGATSGAIGIAFLQSGLIDAVNAFMFISGSRLGATFIVVFIGLLEYMQGKNSDIRDSCSIGLLQFLTTYIVYIPAIILGYLMLENLDMSFLEVQAPAAFNYGLDMIFGPFTSLLSSNLPPSLLFLSSIGILIGSLRLFDRSFKDLSEDRFRSKYLRFQLSNKWDSFAVGAAITLVSTSVALSVGIIVPLYNRGYFRRKEIIPYLMGANLTTMISNIMAAAVIESAVAMKMTLALTISVFIATIAVLTFYDQVYALIQKAFNAVMLRDRYLIAFTGALFLVPLLLIIIF